MVSFTGAQITICPDPQLAFITASKWHHRLLKLRKQEQTTNKDPQALCIKVTHVFLKVVQAELIGFVEELCPVHAARVQDDVCPFPYTVAVDDIISQGPPHCEVHDGMEAQAFVYEALHDLQLVEVCVLKRSLT